MVAELDEPAEQNFVRKHALEQAQTLGIEVREAATRIFSNASGSYSSNVNLAVENSSWNDEKQLQDMYLSRKSFAFDSDAPGAGMTEKRQVFEMALSTADATFQNLDSSEISLTDVSHYFDSDPTNLVQNLRKDGKKPSSYIADTTTANAQVKVVTLLECPTCKLVFDKFPIIELCIMVVTCEWFPFYLIEILLSGAHTF